MKHLFFFKNKKNILPNAFSLAEVLIVISVIGIVATLVVQVIIPNYNKNQYVTRLKQAYTNMNQALMKMSTDNGTIGNIDSYFSIGVNESGDEIAKHFKINKNCRNSIGEGCFTRFNANYDGSNAIIYDYDNDNSKYKFITADGIAYSVASYNSSCTSNGGFDEAPLAPTYNSICGYVYIDVNASKPPNFWGRDIFMFYITSKTSPLLYPSGGFYNAASGVGTLLKGGNYYWRYNAPNERCSSLNKFGHYCTARVMDQGWKMNY